VALMNMIRRPQQADTRQERMSQMKDLNLRMGTISDQCKINNGQRYKAARGVADAALLIWSRDKHWDALQRVQGALLEAKKQAPARLEALRKELVGLERRLDGDGKTIEQMRARLQPLVERQQQLSADRDGSELRAKQELAEATVSGDTARIAKAEASVSAARSAGRSAADQLASLEVQIDALRAAMSAAAARAEGAKTEAAKVGTAVLEAEVEPMAIDIDLALLAAIEALWKCSAKSMDPARQSRLRNLTVTVGASQAARALPTQDLDAVRCEIESAVYGLSFLKKHPYEDRLDLDPLQFPDAA
jgi:chromosome segregation ATPase